MQTKLTKWDVAVIALCLLLALLLFLLPLTDFSRGGSLVVTYRDGQTQVLSLSYDTVLTLTGEDGHTLTVTVKDGRAYVSDSSCPDGLCRTSGSISRHGETLVCLPAGIVLSVRDGKAGEADAIVG